MSTTHFSTRPHLYHRHLPLISDRWRVTEISQIILVLLAPGEAYIVDLRKRHRGREELCEVQDEADSDDEGPSRARCVPTFLSRSPRH